VRPNETHCTGAQRNGAKRTEAGEVKARKKPNGQERTRCSNRKNPPAKLIAIAPDEVPTRTRSICYVSTARAALHLQQLSDRRPLVRFRTPLLCAPRHGLLATAATLRRSRVLPAAKASGASPLALSARAPCAAARCQSRDHHRSARCRSSLDSRRTRAVSVSAASLTRRRQTASRIGLSVSDSGDCQNEREDLRISMIP
jgi:hypothetical protein